MIIMQEQTILARLSSGSLKIGINHSRVGEVLSLLVMKYNQNITNFFF
jgi:hypothetical protein